MQRYFIHLRVDLVRINHASVTSCASPRAYTVFRVTGTTLQTVADSQPTLCNNMLTWTDHCILPLRMEFAVSFLANISVSVREDQWMAWIIAILVLIGLLADCVGVCRVRRTLI
jgi:hypothetical protein